MHRGPIAAIQHRKFRLLIRWKTTLKASSSFRVLPPERFPHTRIFRAFEEIIRLTKVAAIGGSLGAGKALPVTARDDAGLSPDQYMDVFLVGREVFADYLASDAKLVATYSSDARNCVRHALDNAVRHLVDREMREYFLRRGRTERARAEERATPQPAGAWAPARRGA